MALNENKKIAVWATMKTACQMLWIARKQHVALALVSALPSLVIAAFNQTLLNNKFMLIAVLIFWMPFFTILWQRLFLVGPQYFLKITPWDLIKMWLRVTAYGFKIGLVFLAGAMALLAAGFALVSLWRHFPGMTDPHLNTITSVIAVLTLILLLLAIGARFMPPLLGISVGENISLRNSWSIMEGHTAHLLITLLLLILPAVLLNGMIVVAVGFSVSAIGGTEIIQYMTPLEKEIVSLVFSPLFAVISALPIAAQAIIYRDLVPQPEHIVDVVV